jgi:hypothetical protein
MCVVHPSQRVECRGGIAGVPDALKVGVKVHGPMLARKTFGTGARLPGRRPGSG